ncbi:uncharacterized protein LOC127725443 [Mytilus californianus]|uniref:uncharacterized protein LOC127725443 n=1 Tax=Mytilus californianus TaxID=6549 RepID=UPI0022475DF0|nr:uncharacterized protein LOC127725443 [Mytilus californianus]
MESEQNNSAVSAGSRNHDCEGQTEEDYCYIENGNQHAACLPTIPESGLIFPFPSRNVALILEEKDTLEEESSNYPGKGFMESGFINQGREGNVDVEVKAQNTCINQGDIDQEMNMMKAENSTVVPAGNASIDPYTYAVEELPIGGTQLKTDIDPSEDNMEELKSDTACAPVTSYPDTYASPCKLSDGHKAVTESRNEINFDNENFRKSYSFSNFMMEDQTKLHKPAFLELCTQCEEVKMDFTNNKETLHGIDTASSRNCLQDYEINNEDLSSEEEKHFLQPEDLQEDTQHAQTALRTEKKEFQDPEQLSEELNDMAEGVNEDQQMHEIHGSEDQECCSNSGPSLDQNLISSTEIYQQTMQSVRQVTNSCDDKNSHVSVGSGTFTILAYQNYLHQERRLDYDEYSQYLNRFTHNNVTDKDHLALSSRGQDHKTQIRSPVHDEYQRHCNIQSSGVQGEIAESASQTSCTREEPKLDSEMLSQVPSQLIEIQVPTQGSHTSTRTRSTCTVDLLTIIFLQLILMPAVFQYFKDSQHLIYNYEVPRLYDRFVRGEFDNIRLEWVPKLHGRFGSLDFFGEDRYIILPPFQWISHLCDQPTHNYTGITSGLLRIQSCIELVRPPEGRLNLQILEQLLFTAFYHERQENVNPLYQDGQNGSPPPLIIVNFTDAHLNLIHVESLHGIINIGPYRYFVGGFSSLLNRHYTARIYNHSTPEGSVFTYDNDRGQLLPQLYQLGELSLVFLFRAPPQ